MKALTIWQPWASLIMAGAKPWEFRSWRPPAALIGQRLVIHAGAHRISRDELDYLLAVIMNHDVHPDLAAETCLIPKLALPVLDLAVRGKLPMSCALGTVVVGEPRLGTDVYQDFCAAGGMEPTANISPAANQESDQHSNWGWHMTGIEPWDQPMPIRGRQGLWNWPTPEDVLGIQGRSGAMLIDEVAA